MPESGNVIVIIGAGFSGTCTTIHLLRQLSEPVQVVLLEKLPDLARGIAYAKRDFPYRLNVPAPRMSLEPDAPNDFYQWALHRRPDLHVDEFVEREFYGDYLEERLQQAIASAAAGVSFLHRRCTVEKLQADGMGRFSVQLGDSKSMVADTVVIATGHPPANELVSGTADLMQSGTATAAAILQQGDPELPIFFIGTGLTTVDMVLAVSSQRPQRAMHALSRHGLLPLSEVLTPVSRGALGALPSSTVQGLSSLQMMRWLRQAAAQELSQGGDWQDVVTKLRPSIPFVWAGWSVAERRRFLRHARPYWDIHRHRIPADVATQVQSCLDSGQLKVHAGRVLGVQSNSRGVEVTWQRRSGDSQTMTVAQVINCTGANYNVRQVADPLWRSLLAQGLAVADELKMGILTDPNGRVIAEDGKINKRLYYVGPLMRASHFEATAVPELRVIAARVAAMIAQSC